MVFKPSVLACARGAVAKVLTRQGVLAMATPSLTKYSGVSERVDPQECDKLSEQGCGVDKVVHTSQATFRGEWRRRNEIDGRY